MDKTSRALRRHHRARMVRRALSKVQNWDNNQDWILWYARRAADNMAICSCMMCRSERRNEWNNNWMKLTMQERKEFERFLYELEEIDR